MKFSDMMGKGKAETEAADAETEAVTARLKAPPLPEAPIRFGTPPEVADVAEEAPAALDIPVPIEGAGADVVTTDMPAAIASTDARPGIAEVMAELAPRKPEPTAASTQQLDATAWLEGLATIDDDLLPS